MKNIIIFVFLLTAFSSEIKSQQFNELTLSDFNISQTGHSFFLELNRADLKVLLRVGTKPEKIIASYFDDSFLVFVFEEQDKYQYLVGAYNENGQWKQDYFEVIINLRNGLQQSKLKAVEFLDGSTLKMTMETKSIVRNKNFEEKIIWRICIDYIQEYRYSDLIMHGMPLRGGNNQYRPID